ncbi:GIY-YIG nuclease family protein, partial [Streptomyces sp. G35A]
QAGAHSLGKGCRKCGIETSIAKRYVEYTTENFIKKAQSVHGDKYDYSLTEYVNTETKVKIICKAHGMFEQRPKCHEKGKGCIKCRNENTTYNFIQKYRDNVELGKSPGIIYILKVQGNGEEFLKLGITSNKSGRFKRYRKQFKDIGYSHEILFERVMPNYQTAMLENEIFKKFRREDKIYKPLQDFSGKSECVLPDCLDELQSLILEHTEDKYFE